MSAEAGSYLMSFAIVALATAVGAVVERIAVGLLRGAPGRGRPPAVALARALSGTLTAVTFLAAARLVLPRLDLPGRWESVLAVVLAVAAVAVGTVFATRLAARLVRLYTEREDTAVPATSIFVNVVSGVVISLGVLMALDTLGVRIGPLLTALGVGGLAIALALQTTLSNLFAGLQLIGSRQIGPGDYVRLVGGDEGVIVDVGWRVTTIRSATNDLVLVPNAILANSVVVNYSASSHEHEVTVSVPVPREGDPERALALALETARAVQAESPGAVRGFAPSARFGTVGDSQVAIDVVLRATSYADRLDVRSEFARRLLARLAEEETAPASA